MSGPWDKFKKDASSGDGPWNNYKKPAAQPQPLPEQEEGLVERGGFGDFPASVGLGALSGATLGYAERLYPKGAKKIMERQPEAAFLGGLAAPLGALSALKYVDKAGKIGRILKAAPGAEQASKLMQKLAASGKVGSIAAKTLPDIGAGAAIGGLSDPGEQGSRLENAVMGGLGAGILGQAVRSGTKLENSIDLLKDESALLRKAESTRDMARAGLKDKISGYDKAARDMLKGRSADVDLSEFQKLAPESVSRLEQQYPKSFIDTAVPGSSKIRYFEDPAVLPGEPNLIKGELGGRFTKEPQFESVKVKNPNAIATGIPEIEIRKPVAGSGQSYDYAGTPDRVEFGPERRLPGKYREDPTTPITQKIPVGTRLPGEEILNLRQFLDQQKAWKPGKPTDVESVAMREDYASGANKLRNLLEQIQPELPNVMKESKKAITLDKWLKKQSGLNEMLKTPDGSTRRGLLARIDELSGSDFIKTAEDLEGAKDWRLRPTSFLPSIQAGTEYPKAVVRGGTKTLRALGKVPGGQMSIINSLIQSMRQDKPYTEKE